MSSFDCKALNARLVAALRPTTPALGLKYVKTQEQLRAISNINMLAKRGGVCTLVGNAIAFNSTFGIRKERISKMCGGASGCCDEREEFLSGTRISTDFPWHSSVETARQHMLAAMPDLPPCDSIAIAVAPLDSGDIAEPDVVILSLEPGAAYHLLAGFVEKDFQEIEFKFRGEATCIESWNHTYVTGKPGFTFGDRGNRNAGALPANEIRLTLTLSDLDRALSGIERLARDNIFYPYGTTHNFPECEPV